MTTLRQLPLSRRLVHIGLAVVAFALLGRLCLRHAGDSYFLTDQSDQLQYYEALLRFEPEGLWGPLYGQTDPPVHSLGPLPAVASGLPTQLGLGATGMHVLSSSLLVLATLAAFGALATLDLALAWIWLMLFVACGTVWWNAGMLWTNTLLLPLGCALLATSALCLRDPTRARVYVLPLIVAFALHLHLLALVTVPVVALVVACTALAAWRRPTRWPARIGLMAAAFFAVGPYLIAELMTGFRNTRALFGHAPGAQVTDPAVGQAAARQVLEGAADPTGLWASLGVGRESAVLVALVLAAAALGLWGWQAWRTRGAAGDGARAWAVAWLIVAAAVGVASQMVFFTALNRELLSLHYTSILLPFYAVPLAALAAWLIGRLPGRAGTTLQIGLGVACVLLIAWRAPEWADRHWERTPWTYGRITTAVNTMCAPGMSADTLEGRGFASLDPDHLSVLRFLMTRGFVPCRYDRDAERLISASMEAEYPETVETPAGTFVLERTEPPGIALYRRAR